MNAIKIFLVYCIIVGSIFAKEGPAATMPIDGSAVDTTTSYVPETFDEAKYNEAVARAQAEAQAQEELDKALNDIGKMSFSDFIYLVLVPALALIGIICVAKAVD
jgi:hypothetical protein